MDQDTLKATVRDVSFRRPPRRPTLPRSNRQCTLEFDSGPEASPRLARRFSGTPESNREQRVPDLLNPLAGFLVAVLVGFTGVGGDTLMTPLLVFIFGMPPQTAVGSDILFASITKSVGGWVHASRGSIDWLVLRRLCIGSLPSAAHCRAGSLLSGTDPPGSANLTCPGSGATINQRGDDLQNAIASPRSAPTDDLA